MIDGSCWINRPSDDRASSISTLFLRPGPGLTGPLPLLAPLPLQPRFRSARAGTCASWSRETLSESAIVARGRREGAAAAVLRNSRRNSSGGFSRRLGRVYRPRETFWKTSGRERSPIHASRLIVGLGTPLNQAGRFLGIPFSP